MRLRPCEAAGKAAGDREHEVRPLEYGQNALELNADAIGAGARVVIHDDVLATGGTVEAIGGLVEQLGGEVVGVNFIIELTFPGRTRAALEIPAALAHLLLGRELSAGFGGFAHGAPSRQGLADVRAATIDGVP